MRNAASRLLLALPWVLTLVVASGGCPSDALTDAALGVAGTDGRSRYVVTLDAPPVDLSEYRALQKEKPDEVEAYVQRQLDACAAAQGGLDIVVKSFGGRVIHRWWTTNQATIEIPAKGVASVRATPGVKALEPDQALQ